jgi:hypothetical protein
MPTVTSLEALQHAATGFEVNDLELVVEPSARIAGQRSLDESGLLLLGEVHGVRENPLVIRALMQVFGLDALGLEWPDELAPVVRAYAAGGALADHPALWLGDGRITAGHLAVLRERATVQPLDLILFDVRTGVGWSWSQGDEAMAVRILARAAAGAGTLVVAGNAHTPTSPTSLGVPLGACLARRRRPGVLGNRIRYGGRQFYNLASRQFRHPDIPGHSGPIRLQLLHGRLFFDLPEASEAIVLTGRIKAGKPE